jgi:hypothetical protein
VLVQPLWFIGSAVIVPAENIQKIRRSRCVSATNLRAKTRRL